MIYNGLIIKESLKDKKVLRHLNILKEEIWTTKRTNDFHLEKWKVLFFENNDENISEILRELSSALQKKWYISISHENNIYIVFSNKIYCYKKNDKIKLKIAQNYILSYGIPENRMNWLENIRYLFN